MGFDTIQDALAFVEELTANAEAIDAASVGQQLRDLDVYLQHVLKPKVLVCYKLSRIQTCFS